MMNPGYFSKWNNIDKAAAQLGDKEMITVFLPTESKNNVFISTNNNLEHSFWIEFDPAFINDYSAPKVSGVDIKVISNTKLDKSKMYLFVSNIDIAKDEAFIIFSSAVFSELESTSSDSEALRAFEKVVVDFHDFFKFKKSLSKIEEQGLAAELLFLRELISKYGEVAVSFWYGCEKNKRDFIIADKGIEIKSTLNQKQDIIHISNENQLSLLGLKQLYLVLFVFDENNTGLTVTECIKSIYDRLQSAEYKKLFLIKISLLKIDPLNYESNYFFSLECIKSFSVNERFPKLTKDNIPSNVFDLDYYVNISGIEVLGELPL